MIPLFKSHYSMGKSILTLNGRDSKADPEKSDSIVDICANNDLSVAYLVEDSMGGFLEGYRNLAEANIQLRFGYRVSMVDDASDFTDDSRASEHKTIIFAKNKQGFEKLVKLYTMANSEFAYKGARLDYDILENNWDTNLMLAVPFYDSFLFKNTLTFGQCVPKLGFAETVCFVENNHLPFDKLLSEKVDAFSKTNKIPVQTAKSIYYKSRDDFKAWQTFKCMFRKTYGNISLNKPNLEHCASREFCFESWKDQNDT